MRKIDPKTKELYYNPKVSELYAPVAGPANPFKTQQTQAERNILNGMYIGRCVTMIKKNSETV